MKTDKMQTILLVEDSEDNRGLIRQMVDDWDLVALVEADNGVDGVRLAREIRPDMILMDLSLPLMNGWEATKALKGDKAVAHIPIIALTAHAMAGDARKAMEAGCDAYLTKPIDLDDLEEVITSYLKISM